MSTKPVAQPDPRATDETEVEQSGGVAEGGLVDEPTRSDPVVRGLSQAIGGPLGEHAVRPPRSKFGGTRFWTPVRVVLALTCLMLSLHWVQKSPCRDGAWGADLPQYKHLCYTDVLALYYAEGLADGKVPYAGHAVEYPVLTGAFMGVLGLPVHGYAAGHPGINQAQRFYDLNALVLGALGVATVAMILALRRRRPWDAAMFALSPALFVSATVNWDLLAVALTSFFLYFWARRRPALAGLMLGLATAAKFYPLLLAGALIVLALRTARWRDVSTVFITLSTALVTWLAVNAPVALLYPGSWSEFFHLNKIRGVDWGTIWYIGEHFPLGGDRYGLAPFQALDHETGHATLNTLYLLLFVLACAGILLLALGAPRRPRLAQLAFLIVAAFLVTGKVWSQQYVLWLLPLAILARPRWGAFLAWQFAEIAYFVAFYGQLMNASGRTVYPEWVFVLASALRLATVCVMIGFVVRDILRPSDDVVRRTYADDPDGGVFDGAPDASWLRRARERASARIEAAPATR
ncbi:MAG TPA: glycosyltransferase 87 family protein [Planosporangium sp.]|nr:glycosyltransferase 87 family protein [Planosporangium sp.]